MNTRFTQSLFFLLFALLFTQQARAQFYRYMELNNYINSEVRAEAGGLTFQYMIQAPNLSIKRYLLHTTTDGTPVWTKSVSPNVGNYLLLPDSSMILTGGASISGTRIGLIQKLNTDGTVAWKRKLTSTTNDVAFGQPLLSGNTILVTFTRSSFFSNTYYSRAGIIAIDQSGETLWTRYFSNSAFTTDYSFSRSMIAANGDIVAIADIRGSMNAQANGMMVTRVTPQGTIVFSNYLDLSSTHTQAAVNGLVETASGDLIFGGRLMGNQISEYPNSMWLGRMDAAGELLLQKVYSGGTDVGEQLHSLRYANNKLYAYVQISSPFESPSQGSAWVGLLDPQTLSFTDQNALSFIPVSESPYGQVPDAFCITPDGKPTISAGFYCTATERYHALLLQFGADFETSCLETTRTLSDSTVQYPFGNYTSAASFTTVLASDTSTMQLINEPLLPFYDLCEGCVALSVETLAQDDIQVYPNPGNGLYNLHVPAVGADDAFTIYNTTGAVVLAGRLSAPSTPVNLTDQPPGMYYVAITTNGRQTTHKLVHNK